MFLDEERTSVEIENFLFEKKDVQINGCEF